MNIIKCKDVILTPENAPELTDEQRVLFNEKLRDRYVHVVNWRYILPLEEASNSEVSDISALLCNDYNEQSSAIFPAESTLELSLVNDFIDPVKTEKANGVTRFIEANRFSSDSDITTEELMRFRTWLAETLYNMLIDTGASYETIEMLNYYKNEMNDDTIQHLLAFVNASKASVIYEPVSSTCGCGNANANLELGVSTCDAISMYREAIYKSMVRVFSDLAFWLDKETELIIEFKKYIDGILHKGFPLALSNPTSDLYDCGCLHDVNPAQAKGEEILKDLSKSLGYIISGETTGNKNFIGDSLNRWAAFLYEKMRWYSTEQP